MSSKILSDRQVDDPIQQSAAFRYDKLDRAYVDEQIRGTQQHVVDNLISGLTATWFTVSADSGAVEVGDVVCVGGSTPIQYFVTKALAAALANAGRPLGICLTSAAPGADVRVAMAGVIPPTITGLVPSDNRAIRVSSAGRCETVAAFSTGDYPLGYIDNVAYLSLAASTTTGEGGPLTGDAGGHLALTYPNPALANGRSTKADLRALTHRAHRSEIHIAENNRAYRLDTTVGANVADNGYDCIKPTDVLLASNGRWVGLGETEVPTIAALRTLTSGYSAKVHVRAFSTEGDGGGGHFVKKTGTATDNGGTVIVPTGITTFYYLRQYAGDIDDRWFGGTTDLAADSAPAINAAIQAASQNASSTGFAFAGQSVVVNGRRRCSSPIHLEAGVTLQGVAGAHQYGASALYFDEGIEGFIVEDHTGPHAMSAQGAVVRDLQILQNNSINNPYVNGLYPLTRNTGLRAKTKVHLENLHVAGWSGDGVNIGDGANVNCWSMSGFITVDRCFGAGMIISGGEASAGNMGAMLNIYACGNIGLYASSFLGNGYPGTIHTQGNGYKEIDGLWIHGDLDQAAFIWSSGKVVNQGEIILPPPADKNGVVYIARNAGTLAVAGAFPAWSTTVGNTFTSGTVTVEVWAVEGMGIYSPGGGVKSNSWGYIYCELDQNPSELHGDTMLGGIQDLEITLNSDVRNGFVRNRSIPTPVSTRGETDSTDSNGWAFYLKLDWGGQPSHPLTAYRYSADPVYGLTTDGGAPGYFADQGFVGMDWNPLIKRWSHGYGVSWVGYTQPGGRSMPSPGAMCFTSLWTGPVGKERRIAALPSTSLFQPDFTQATAQSLALGAYQEGDFILNTCGTLETPTQRYPFGWRPKRFGGGTPQGWLANTWQAGYYRRPGECIVAGTNIWRALNEGSSGAPGTEPAWGTPTSYTTKVDNQITWEFVGSATETFEPVITQAPTMLSKSVAAGGTITLTEDEAAHERIKFTGSPGGALSVVVPAGAGTGWSRDFWNASTQTVTVKGSGGDTGVAVTSGSTLSIFSDGTNCRTASGTAGPPGSSGITTFSFQSQAIEAHTSVGYGGSFDIDLVGPFNQVKVVSDGVDDWALNMQNAGATQGDRVEFIRTDVADAAFDIKNQAGTVLYSMSPAGTRSPSVAVVIFDGSVWILGPVTPGLS